MNKWDTISWMPLIALIIIYLIGKYGVKTGTLWLAIATLAMYISYHWWKFCDKQKEKSQ